MINNSFFTLYFFLLLIAGTGNSTATQPRHSFAVPLAWLQIAYEPRGTVEEVTISYGGDSEAWAIGAGDDRYVKNTQRLLEDRTYKEVPSVAFQLSSFEAQQLDRVCQGLIETLEILERDLKREQYARLRYLDCYFPKFMKGWYHLIILTYCDTTILAPICDISPYLFDDSFDSPKTDTRVAIWENSAEHRLKLRIAAKEAHFQLQNYRKKVLSNPKLNSREWPNTDLTKSWELLVRLYFGLRPFEIDFSK